MSDENVEKDHEFQAIDTEIPDGETVDTEAWEAMRDEWIDEHPDEAA